MRERETPCTYLSRQHHFRRRKWLLRSILCVCMALTTRSIYDPAARLIDAALSNCAVALRPGNLCIRIYSIGCAFRFFETDFRRRKSVRMSFSLQHKQPELINRATLRAPRIADFEMSSTRIHSASYNGRFLKSTFAGENGSACHRDYDQK